MNPDGLDVILGADSLVGRRSGIGRMTWEIASRLDGHPVIRTLALRAGSALHDAAWLQGDLAPPVVAADVRRGLAERLAQAPGLPQVRNLWRRRLFGRQAAALVAPWTRLPIYHETNFIPAPYPGPTTVTVHDLFWHTDPAFVPAERRRWLDRNIGRTLREVHRFVCVSHFTAGELAAHFGVDRSRIAVVPEAASDLFRPMAAAEAKPVLDGFGLGDRRYILAASTLEPRKNFDRLVAAHGRLPVAIRQRVPLVIAGGEGWGDVLPSVEAARAAGELRLIGHVSDHQLAALMARAALFAFVSLKEGFGLPVLEAMASDTAVVAANTTATAETAGDGAVLVDPCDVGAITEAMRRLLEDPDEAAAWRARGLRRAQDFSWAATVDGLIEVWRSL